MVTFGLVAGGCHNAWCWGRLTEELTDRGHEAIAVELPTDDPTAGFQEYADVVAAALDTTCSGLVLVGHSIAGRYLPLAAGTANASRMVFLCASIPEEGVTNVFSGAHGQPEYYDDQGRFVIPSAEAGQLFYHDCDEATTQWALGLLRPQGVRVQREALPIGSWPPGILSACIVCEDDPVMTPERARSMAMARLGVPPIILPGGHSPFLSQAAALADCLVKILDDDHEHWGEGPPPSGN